MGRRMWRIFSTNVGDFDSEHTGKIRKIKTLHSADVPIFELHPLIARAQYKAEAENPIATRYP